MRFRERLRSGIRRWRVRRFERRQMTEHLRDERAVAHVERQREGIRDVPPPDAGGAV
jgi:hypothetical protein